MRGPEVKQAVDAALGAIQLYSDMWGSASPFKEQFQKVLECLRAKGKSLASRSDGSTYGQGKFLLHFADALELSNRSGEYEPHQGMTKLRR